MNSKNDNPLIAVVGPTASGKTALGVQIARKFNGEVISADSMQIYKQMDIATAKPKAEEMMGVRHRLIDFLDTNCSFSVADYVKCAKKEIAEIYSLGKIPVLVGGTGLYVTSLIDNISFDVTCSNTARRKELLKLAEEKGNKYLLDMLAKIDPECADSLHPNNLNRIIRAIEVYETTGITMTQSKINSRQNSSPYALCMIGLTYRDRQLLYEKINKRVDRMLDDGLLNEALDFYSRTDTKTAVQAIGYKELFPYFKGEKSLNDCIESLKKETRHYAKRQLTWFNRDERINWIYADEFDSSEKIIETAEKIIAKSEIVCYNNDV